MNTHTCLIQENAIFSCEQLNALNSTRIPEHVAFIPDGNRRWARKQMETVASGHREGADNIMEIVKAAKAIGIKTVTFYIFSTENWTRDNDEVQALLCLLDSYLKEKCPVMLENDIRLHTIGDESRFPHYVQETIRSTKADTAHCKSMNMVFAVNYGARDELRRAFEKIMSDHEQGKLNKQQITEQTIASYLDTSQFPDPELLIRTSGELRVSNFLLWQISYAEVCIVDVLWPDFTPNHLLQAILEFQKRERRWGGA